MINLAVVPVGLVPLLWSQMEPLILLAAELTPEEVCMKSVKLKLFKGETMPLIVYEDEKIIAVNILELQHFETGLKALVATLVGGTRMEEWGLQVLELEKKIAKDVGCHELRGFAARKGWMRKLVHLGWEEIHTTIRCKI